VLHRPPASVRVAAMAVAACVIVRGLGWRGFRRSFGSKLLSTFYHLDFS
jgi:hypothetical protein